MSAVEFGRDAAPAREARLSMGSRFGAEGDKDMSILGDRSMDQGGEFDPDAFAQGEMDYQPMDVDLGLDVGMDDVDPYADMGGAGFDFGADTGELPELDPAGERRESRECQSTPPISNLSSPTLTFRARVILSQPRDWPLPLLSRSTSRRSPT